MSSFIPIVVAIVLWFLFSNEPFSLLSFCMIVLMTAFYQSLIPLVTVIICNIRQKEYSP